MRAATKLIELANEGQNIFALYILHIALRAVLGKELQAILLDNFGCRAWASAERALASACSQQFPDTPSYA